MKIKNGNFVCPVLAFIATNKQRVSDVLFAKKSQG